METRQSCRKRRSSLISHSQNESPNSHQPRNETVSDNAGPEQTLNTTTPRKPKKRVRFSDPGPRLNDTSLCSTGLTPAMKRTSFAHAESSWPGDRTPSRKTRRRSAPTPRFQQSFDPIEPFDETCSERVMQFTPLRQILDTRTQRKIRRIGLSDEINSIEREKRDAASFEKRIETLLRERDILKDDLNALRWNHICPGPQSPASESFWLSPQDRIQRSEEERLSDEVSTTSNQILGNDDPSVSDEGDTFPFNESTLLVSHSPDFRAMHDYRSPVSDTQITLDQTYTNGSAQTQPMDITAGLDIHDFALDLEAAKSAKRELFNACRSQMSTFEDSGMEEILRRSSPPPDFFDNVITILTTALSRASQATQTLEGINEECSSLGFSGTDAEDVISNVKSHFRSARLELERAIPGETPDAGLENGKATLGALVKRVSSLAQDLQTERTHHCGSLGREKALRGQFDNLLHRYEAAANRIGNLEDSIAASAGDMLHTRIRMRDLETETQEKDLGLERLNAALNKYREDVKSLEGLVSKLEDENKAAKGEYIQQISELERQVISEREKRSAMEVSVSEYESRIRQLEETVEQNRIRAGDLTAAAEALEKEHQETLKHLEQKANEQLQQCEEDIGTLNVRISDLTTSLEDTKSEAHRLRQINAGLEEQLQMEIDARDELLDRWAAEQARSFAYARETVNSERRRAKVRAANWELRSDDLMSDGTTVMGSEPITPVSMTRFVDVEMGRGKNRRRMDSGIGILTEDDLLGNEEISIRRGLDSDIDLPTSDLVDT